MFTALVRVSCSFVFDISHILHNSASRLWLRTPGNSPVVDLYGSWVTLTIMSTANVLSWPGFVPGLHLQRAGYTNRPEGKLACCKHNHPDVKTGSLSVFSHSIGNTADKPVTV